MSAAFHLGWSAGCEQHLFRNKHDRVKRTIEDDKKNSTKHPQNSEFSGNHIFHFRSDEISRLSGVLGVQSQWCRPFLKKNRWAWRCGGSTCSDLVPWKRWENPGWKTLKTVFWPENQGWAAKKIQAEWAPPNSWETEKGSLEKIYRPEECHECMSGKWFMEV